MPELLKNKLSTNSDFFDQLTQSNIHRNLNPAELVELALQRGEGNLTSTGALMTDTGEFTGRSPKDRFIVLDQLTKDSVWWGDINIPFEEKKFDSLLEKMKNGLKGKELFVRDCFAGAIAQHRLSIRVLTTLAWHNLFCHNMFIRPSKDELYGFEQDFTIICDPSFKANPEEDGTRSSNFSIINLSKKIILIGGTAYAGEIKKGIFSVLNFILPHENNVLSMHCSANVGEKDDVAIFFGLSGTGKTTLSTDQKRSLIGDDEHGWTESGVFNFEGGCYAKVIDLKQEKEPEIWNAIKFGAIVENTRFKPGTREIDFTDKSVTENTRTAYPLNFISNTCIPSVAGIPKNIFFLTADAFGVIPPISRLNKNQAMYHFISGYTAKVAGTEVGITEPKMTFSACFGAAFMPLHPAKYASLLGEKLDTHQTNVWMINTGWTGGPYGVGSRIKLQYTRAMIAAILESKLDETDFSIDPYFGFQVPSTCPDVPSSLLDVKGTWANSTAYDQKAMMLVEAFKQNFKKFENEATGDILAGGPN